MSTKINIPAVVQLADGRYKSTADCTLGELKQARKLERNVSRKRELSDAIRLFDGVLLSALLQDRKTD